VAYACAREAAARALHDAAWSWAAAEVDRLAGPGAPGGGFDAVGAVLGLVTLGALDAEEVRDADADVTARRAAQLWQRAGALAASRAPGTLRFVAHRLVRRGLDTVLPAADREDEHWRVERGTVVAHEHLALDYLVAAALWRHRRHHPGLGRPPAVLLLDPQRPALGLRPPLGLDADGREAWTAWRSATAVDGPAPMQAAGEGFLLAATATAPGG